MPPNHGQGAGVGETCAGRRGGALWQLPWEPLGDGGGVCFWLLLMDSRSELQETLARSSGFWNVLLSIPGRAPSQSLGFSQKRSHGGSAVMEALRRRLALRSWCFYSGRASPSPGRRSQGDTHKARGAHAHINMLGVWCTEHTPAHPHP